MIYAGTIAPEDGAAITLVLLILLVVLVAIPVAAIIGLTLVVSGLREKRAGAEVRDGIGPPQPPDRAAARADAKIGFGLMLLAPIAYFLVRLVI